MSVNVKDLKDKVIAGASVGDLTEDEVRECIDFCQRTWIAWRKSNVAAETKRKIVSAAMKDPEVKAFLAARGMTL